MSQVVPAEGGLRRVIGGGRFQRVPRDRVERPAVVGDLERRGAVVHAGTELDLVLTRTLVGVADDIAQQLGCAELEAPDVLGLDGEFRAETTNPVGSAPDRGELAVKREPARRR